MPRPPSAFAETIRRRPSLLKWRAVPQNEPHNMTTRDENSDEPGKQCRTKQPGKWLHSIAAASPAPQNSEWHPLLSPAIPIARPGKSDVLQPAECRRPQDDFPEARTNPNRATTT